MKKMKKIQSDFFLKKALRKMHARVVNETPHLKLEKNIMEAKKTIEVGIAKALHECFFSRGWSDEPSNYELGSIIRSLDNVLANASRYTKDQVELQDGFLEICVLEELFTCCEINYFELANSFLNNQSSILTVKNAAMIIMIFKKMALDFSRNAEFNAQYTAKLLYHQLESTLSRLDNPTAQSGKFLSCLLIAPPLSEEKCTELGLSGVLATLPEDAINFPAIYTFLLIENKTCNQVRSEDHLHDQADNSSTLANGI